MRRLLLPVVPLALLLGCNTPVGTYRVDSAQVLESSCSGVDPARTSSWVDALNADPATDMQIGTKSGEIQAQLQRSDGTVLYAPVTDAGDNTWSGSRFVEGSTTSEGLLGSDFSGLLEIDGICTFDLTIDVSLDFGEEGFDSVSGRFRATLDEAATGTPCDIQSCSALIAVGAGRTSSVNPGVQSTSDE